MRQGKPSFTSSMVAFYRGLNTLGLTAVRDFSDPFAAQLLSPGSRLALRGFGWMLARRPDLKERLLTQTEGMLDLVAACRAHVHLPPRPEITSAGRG